MSYKSIITLTSEPLNFKACLFDFEVLRDGLQACIQKARKLLLKSVTGASFFLVIILCKFGEHDFV